MQLFKICQYYSGGNLRALQPSVGMIFDSWEQGKSFYKAYADHAGFSIRTWTQHKGGDVVKLKKFVSSKEGWRKEGKKRRMNKLIRSPKEKSKLLGLVARQ